MSISETRASWPKLVVAMLVAGAAWTVWAPAIRSIVSPALDFVRSQQEETFDNGVVAPGRRVEVSGFHAGAYGWCLAPGASGTLTWRSVTTGEQPRLKAWLYRPPNGATRLEVSVDGSTWRPVYVSDGAVPQRTMVEIDLGVHVAAGHELALRLGASNPTAEEVLVLDQWIVGYRTSQASSLPQPRAVLAMVVSFGLVAVVASRRRAEVFATVLILALAASLRYDAAIALLGAPLDPDAIGYRKYANTMALFTDAGFFPRSSTRASRCSFWWRGSGICCSAIPPLGCAFSG